MNQDINYIINKIKRNKVLVVGDIILDCSIDGEISGLSAEAPIMTFREHKVTYTLGGAANVALNLKNAHQDVFLVSIVGSDDSAKTIKSLLHNADISSDGLIVDVTRRTTVKKRYYTKLKEQIFRSDNEDCFEIERRIEELIVEKITERIDCVDVVVLSDYLKGCLTRNLIKSIVCLAHQKGIKVIVDPKDADFSKYANCDVLKPNKKELALMLNKSSLTYTDILVGSKRICE